MKTPLRILVIVVFFFVTSSTLLYSADLLGDSMKKGLPKLPGSGSQTKGQPTGAGLDDSTIASGLKDALSVGTKNAVNVVSKDNGYFGNKVIKILLPDKIQRAADWPESSGPRNRWTSLFSA